MKRSKLKTIVITLIVGVTVMILGFYIGVGIGAIKLFFGEKPASEKVGEAAKDIKDGFNKGFYGDSIGSKLILNESGGLSVADENDKELYQIGEIVE